MQDNEANCSTRVKKSSNKYGQIPVHYKSTIVKSAVY